MQRIENLEHRDNSELSTKSQGVVTSVFDHSIEYTSPVGETQQVLSEVKHWAVRVGDIFLINPEDVGNLSKVRLQFLGNEKKRTWVYRSIFPNRFKCSL